MEKLDPELLDFIRRAILHKSKSLSNFADIHNFDRSSLSLFLSGARVPKVTTFFEYLKAANTNIVIHPDCADQKYLIKFTGENKYIPFNEW